MASSEADCNKEIGHVPPDPPHKVREAEPDRASFADPQKKALLAAVSKVEHLTGSIGTILHGVQLNQLKPQQKDELALLVAERGVVFFRDQTLSTEEQVEFFQHYGTLDTHPAQKDTKFLYIAEATSDHRAELKHSPWPRAEFHADTSFELNAPSYSLLRFIDAPSVDGDTLWVSQYGAYDALSPALQEIASSLHAVHSSRLQYETLLVGGSKPRRKPVDTVHPLVRTHPVTGLRALHWNPGFSLWIDEFKKAESDALGKFFTDHLNNAADHQVRWKWTPGSVAFWDNRVSAHRVIPGNYTEKRLATRTTVFGERAYFDPKSEGRQVRRERLAKEAAKATGGDGSGNGTSGVNGDAEHGVNGY
ncbi:alpha-ketoglutarate-dependent sulfonate dioxygenase [Meredithblackwellia eburnea MCA 4105]